MIHLPFFEIFFREYLACGDWPERFGDIPRESFGSVKKSVVILKTQRHFPDLKSSRLNKTNGNHIVHDHELTWLR
jgi:hypothetical protein